MNPKSIVPLSARKAAYRFKDHFQLFVANVLRLIPGLARVLGIPVRRVKSIKTYIAAVRGNRIWSARMRSPLYTTLFPATQVVPAKPKCPTATSEPMFCTPVTSNKSYNYWDIRSGFDSRKGFCVKHLLQYDEVFLAYIPNGRILGPSGVVLSEKMELFEESIWTWERWVERDRAMRAWRLPAPEKIDSPCYVVTSKYTDGYPHWLMESLPRLYGLKSLPKGLKPTLIFPKALKQWHIDTINLLGFGDYPRLILDDKFYEVAHLYLPSFVGLPGTPHREGMQWVVDTIKSNLDITPGKERIYITRRLVNRRVVLNEAELIPILEKYGFKVLEAETLSFAEQVKYFSRAEAIVTSHGAGLANIMFAPKGCKVLEILDMNYVNDHYYNLAGVFDLDYYYQLCTSYNYDNHLPLVLSCDDISISPALLEVSLKAMFPQG